jgi:hypothetical protein
MRNTFFVGVYPGLTDEMIDFVVETLTGYFRTVNPGLRVLEYA